MRVFDQTLDNHAIDQILDPSNTQRNLVYSVISFYFQIVLT